LAYDIIGDVHGHARKLRSLLDKMGYRETRGAYRHSSCEAIFVGDLIDRGPANIEAATIARQMVEEGTARIVMGNHEFNAIAFHTEDPDRPGEFLRPHTGKNLKQHQATLAEFEARPDQKRLLLDWFRTLPVFLDLPDIRVVHACWDRQSLTELRPRLNADNSMSEELFISACRKGSNVHAARDALINGYELDLPNPVYFLDKDGHRRTAMRLKWWLCGSGPLPLRNAGLGLDEEQRVSLPDRDLPRETHHRFAPDGKPTFFGHYWFSERLPAPTSPTTACVDYSVALGGSLVAYRWHGEAELSRDRFCYV
jgi:Calcineurin-like phosphoesterase